MLHTQNLACLIPIKHNIMQERCAVLHYHMEYSTVGRLRAIPVLTNREFVKRLFVNQAATFQKCNVIIVNYVPELPKNDQKHYKSTVLLPEKKCTNNGS